MNSIGEIIIETFKNGGLFFTCPIFLLLLLMIGIWMKAMLSDKITDKYIFLIAQIGWFALAWGYLGRTIGLIEAFDKVAELGDFAPYLISEGLKKALINPVFGLVSFLLARLGIIILKFKQKEGQTSD